MLPPPRRSDLSTKSKASPQQSGPAPQWATKWIFILLGLAVLAGAVWFGLRRLNRWRVEGEGFSINASRRVSELMQRRVSFTRLRETGADEFSTASVTLAPVLQDLLNSADFSEVTAQFAPGSLLAEDWTLRSLRCQRADLSFQPAKTLDQDLFKKERPALLNRGPSAPSSVRLGLTADPTSILLQAGRCDELNLRWPGPAGRDETLNHLAGTIRVAGPAVTGEFSGGLLETTGMPPMSVRQLNLRLEDTGLEIISARLGFTADHEIRLSGKASLTPAGRVELQADIAPILLKHLLPEIWTNTARGTFESTGATWLSHFQSGPAPSLSGPFKVKGLVFRNLPFVDKIAQLLRKPELSLLEFPLATGDFHWTARGTHLRGFSATTGDGLLTLKADLTVALGESITGTCVIEASETFFAGLAGDATTLFAPSRPDWRALRFTLGGTEAAVTDDIAISTPVVIQNQPVSLELPKMSLPRGSTPPATLPATPPAPPTAPAPLPSAAAAPSRPEPRPIPRPATPPAGKAVPLRTLPPPVIPAPVPPPSNAELERQFRELLGR